MTFSSKHAERTRYSVCSFLVLTLDIKILGTSERVELKRNLKNEATMQMGTGFTTPEARDRGTREHQQYCLPVCLLLVRIILLTSFSSLDKRRTLDRQEKCTDRVDIRTLRNFVSYHLNCSVETPSSCWSGLSLLTCQASHILDTQTLLVVLNHCHRTHLFCPCQSSTLHSHPFLLLPCLPFLQISSPLSFFFVDGVNYCDSRLGKLTQTFNTLMKTLSEADYVERKDLYASPRISLFRLADDQDLKNLSKRPSANSKNKVVLGGHSACGIVTHRFVTSGIVDQSWIDAYIFVVISSGAPSAVLRWRLVLQRRQEVDVPVGVQEMNVIFGMIDDSRCSSVIFVQSLPFFPSQFGESTINILTQDCGCLHWMIPSKNTFDDNYVVGQLKSSPSSSNISSLHPLSLSHLSACKGDIMRNITMKNRTWTFDQGGKAGLKTDIQHTRNITDKPLVKPKVMTHVMYSIGVTTTAGVILNATNPRRWSDTHSDYYVDGDGTVPIVSLSVLRKWRDTSLVEFHTYRGCDHMGIITDAVPIGHILDITAPETAANMEDEDSLNPPTTFRKFHPFCSTFVQRGV
ncbi:hypothetical protein BLNAU_24252 [Blattamonas nauphoetae]|uniref:Uncharacterized protein n=1 Tax=Blattamonas nauphoetae TaxID=2049346 RepID=A0ABQ9WMY5_9EUKA|nr:hypothetical protein BLNAU_24252 [Blattamonas nauphoetae]